MSAGNRRKQAHVLIVEDTEENIDILMDTLSDEFSVSVAVNGAVALKLVEKQMPDLILLDIQMPVMDGYETCKRLKSRPETATIPIMFLTALTEDGDESKGLALGAVDYIQKPYNPYLVKARVRNQVELKRYKDLLEDLVEERTKKLSEAHEKLRLIDGAKNDFLGAISHELRTPVNGVLGVAQIAIDYIPDQAVKNELSQLFDIGNKRLIETVENGVLLAQIQSASDEIECDAVNLTKLLALVVDEFCESNVGKDVQIISELDSIMRVSGNERLVRQALGTMLKIGVNMAFSGSVIEILEKRKDNSCGVVVRARGKQFSTELLKTVFDPFSYERASSYISELGLATPLADKIIRMFGGELSLENIGDDQLSLEMVLPTVDE